MDLELSAHAQGCRAELGNIRAAIHLDAALLGWWMQVRRDLSVVARSVSALPLPETHWCDPSVLVLVSEDERTFYKPKLDLENSIQVGK